MALVTFSDIADAANRLAGRLVETPLVENGRLGDELGCRVLVKAENLQHTGSFKPRGALNTLLSWRDSGRLPAGVVSFSAGNHAAAVAYAGRMLGVRVVVAMPGAANPSKVANVRRFGGEIVPTDDLLGTCAALGREYGWPALYPFDMPEVIAGQGTVGSEICARSAPDLVLVPVGGGGLVGGIATAVKALSPATRVIGVEPAASAALGRALRAGKVVPLEASAPTLAESLAAPFAGEHTLAQAQAYLDDVVTVEEDAIAQAWTESVDATKLLLEPAAAVGWAALRSGAAAAPRGGTVVLVASGGNVEASALAGHRGGPTRR